MNQNDKKMKRKQKKTKIMKLSMMLITFTFYIGNRQAKWLYYPPESIQMNFDLITNLKIH